MRIGIFIDSMDVDEFVGHVRTCHAAGFGSVWAPQIFGLDALTALAIAGREVPDIAFGTAVVPTYPRHPMMLATQALTTQLATGGRLRLGIGLSHKLVVESMWGISFDKPVRHMREYLSALMPLLHTKSGGFAGETLTAMGQLTVSADIPAPPVLVAALGPQMLKLAGSLADGTITWMTGPKTIGAHIVPHITQAADEAGRPSPQVVAGLPIAVTDDENAAREAAASVFQVYGFLPSYRAMLDREGLEGPANIVVAGDESSVRAQIEHVFTQGATELLAVPFFERERTMAFLAELVAEG
jgi:F420-dependent oxidoreductase-like protein